MRGWMATFVLATGICFVFVTVFGGPAVDLGGADIGEDDLNASGVIVTNYDPPGGQLGQLTLDALMGPAGAIPGLSNAVAGFGFTLTNAALWMSGLFSAFVTFIFSFGATLPTLVQPFWYLLAFAFIGIILWIVIEGLKAAGAIIPTT